ncbi:MAG: hydroxyisourate hydrolase [Nocardioides sp.]
MTISTHVLDATHGRPAVGLSITLGRIEGDVVQDLGSGLTNADGRCPELTEGLDLAEGTYRMRFETAAWFDAVGIHDYFYPYAEVVFTVTDAAAHHHVPLLLSPFAYSTYRGS